MLQIYRQKSTFHCYFFDKFVTNRNETSLVNTTILVLTE